MLEQLGEITDLYTASKMFDVAFQPHLNGIYEVGYHCQRRVHHCYGDEILTVLRSLGESATDASFMHALGVEGYDARFSTLARLQNALGDQPLVHQVEEIKKVFDGLNVSVNTHNEAIVLRRNGDEICITEKNAIDFFVMFLPSALAYKQFEIFDYNKMAHESYITNQYTLDLR
ncbi:TPA: hypothetical protein ACJXXT_000256 [Pseudomonas aeruginosa]